MGIAVVVFIVVVFLFIPIYARGYVYDFLGHWFLIIFGWPQMVLPEASFLGSLSLPLYWFLLGNVVGFLYEKIINLLNKGKQM